MKKFCFPKKFKLLSKIDFKLAKPLKISHRYFLISYQANDKPHAKLGVIVSKRMAKLAVTRNQVKRIVRESFRLNQHKLSGYNFIVIAKQHCDKVNKLELREGVESLWQRLISRFQHVSPQ